MKAVALSLALVAGFMAAPAGAQTIKIAYIDPLSGGVASIGEQGLKHFQFIAEQINAKRRLNGKKLEIIGFDNKTNPQESLVQLQKAIDRASASSRRATARRVAAALIDAVAEAQRAQPRQGGALPQLRRGRPGPHQRQVQLTGTSASTPTPT